MYQKIIDPIPTEVIEAELATLAFCAASNKGGNELYVFDGRKSPNLMREVGRLREESFRAAGGGTGKDCDIDRYDLMDPPCMQLVVWDPDAKLILGGYRFITGDKIKIEPDGSPRIATAHMFEFSDDFVKNYLPRTIEPRTLVCAP